MTDEITALKTKAQARKWAREMIAADIRANIDNGSFGLAQAADSEGYALAIAALKELAKRLDPKQCRH